MIIREEEQLRRKVDVCYTCSRCGRKNSSYNTLMKDDKPQCLYACLPLINTLVGSLLSLYDRRESR
jgi:DNA-directed RNA polymerase subunit RPC12/RpoP